jgi:D-2-hydroxyacid dehydrogenase (NADP+)
MPGLLTSQAFFDNYADELTHLETSTGFSIERLVVPQEGRVAAELMPHIELAYFSGEIREATPLTRRFFGAVTRAPNLRWLHVAHAGVDDPVFARVLASGARMSTSSGSTAVPIAQSAIAGLLVLARGVLYWLEAQQRHVWSPRGHALAPADLQGQTLVVLGLGAIGNEIARLGRALGLHVIGVRRSPRSDRDQVDELHAPGALASILPRADWLAVACPLTEATRGMLDARHLAMLPVGACLINIARGEIVDEAALIAALQSGQIAGAYLDVFNQEPLPADSPLWEMPNVLISPHDSAASAGNRARADRMFIENLGRWARGATLLNEITVETL